ncbi:MAG: hypothetical protein HPY74_12370 [Firmicutes bacterium]|nr:hypothetical protein [Bacillota bacterium]
MKETKSTSRGRVMAALYGDIPNKTPFTIYEEKIERSEYERNLRNNGLCLVKRVVSYSIRRPNVKIRSYSFTDEKGRYLIRTIYSTPQGELTTLVQPDGFTTWTHERMFKSPEDYKALLFFIKDSVVVPNYDAVCNLQERLGEDYVVRDNLPLEPLQALISDYMGIDRYCIEWMDNRDEIMKLYDALVDVARKIYPIVAEGPLEFCNYGGNVIPMVIGEENFKKYFVPHYNEAAEILHKKGKLIGCHLDGDNTLIMNAVAETALDYIEAYDPGISPSVAEARKVWPDKTLWLNWPSSWQLESAEEIYNKTMAILKEAAPGNNFILGVTEDIPKFKIKENLTSIASAINDYDNNKN